MMCQLYYLQMNTKGKLEYTIKGSSSFWELRSTYVCLRTYFDWNCFAYCGGSVNKGTIWFESLMVRIAPTH